MSKRVTFVDDNGDSTLEVTTYDGAVRVEAYSAEEDETVMVDLAPADIEAFVDELRRARRVADPVADSHEVTAW